jgi:putative addiction module killer protein
MIEVREYITEDNRNLYAEWFDDLRPPKSRLLLFGSARGTFPAVKPVGAGFSEYKIGFGPGYRIYFGKDGDRNPAGRRHQEKTAGRHQRSH